MSPVRLGTVLVEPERNRIVSEGGVHRITAREMDVLSYLMRNGTRVVAREEILDGVWSDVIVNDEALTVVVSRLRAVLADSPSTPRIIETIPKKGYRLMIEAVDAGAAIQTAKGKRRTWTWITLLTILLVLMTFLFTVVRSEYGRAESALEEVRQSSD